MSTDQSTATTENHGNDAINAYCRGDMSLKRLAETLGIEPLAARNLLLEQGIQLHDQDRDTVTRHESQDHHGDSKLSVTRTFAPREWVIQAFRIDRWIDETRSDKPYSFEEMKDALARYELLRSDIRYRGYNHGSKKIYEPM